MKRLTKSTESINHFKKYHPWAASDGDYMVFESKPYKGGVIVRKIATSRNCKYIEKICERLNR